MPFSPSAKDLGLRLTGAGALAIYGTVVGFVGLFVMLWDNKGTGSMWHKPPEDWLVVLWCLSCSVLAFVAMRACLVALGDRRVLRVVISSTVVFNAVWAVLIASSNPDITTWLIIGMPGLLGLVGITAWRFVRVQPSALASNQSVHRPLRAGDLNRYVP